MKKIVKFIIALVVILFVGVTAFLLSFSQDKGIKTIINGKEIKTDILPQITDNITMVPLREICEELGAEIKWNEADESVEIRKEWNKLYLDTASKYYKKNETELMMETAPIMKNKHILVPLSFIENEFQCKTNFNEDGNQITLDKMDAYEILTNYFAKIKNYEIQIFENKMLTILRYNKEKNIFVLMNGISNEACTQQIMAVFGADGEHITFNSSFESDYEYSQTKGAFYKNTNINDSAVVESHNGTQKEEFSLNSAVLLIQLAGKSLDNYFEKEALNIKMSDLGFYL